jgi:hypothetical protein
VYYSDSSIAVSNDGGPDTTTLPLTAIPARAEQIHASQHRLADMRMVRGPSAVCIAAMRCVVCQRVISFPGRLDCVI